MNHHTLVNEKFNPCTAKLDYYTYGCRLLNISFWGNRLVRINLGRILIDVYWFGFCRERWFFVARCKNAITWFTPIGCTSWTFSSQGASDDG